MTSRGGRDRSNRQQRGLAALASHAHHAELRGAPNELAWPAICANCGAPASERIAVRKVFKRRHPESERYTSRLFWYKVYSARIPFCASCARDHRATVNVPTITGAVTALLFHPNIIAIIGFTWLLRMSLRDVHGFSLTDPRNRSAWEFVALPLLGLAWSLGLAWRLTLPSRIPPQTEVTLACDFSNDVSELYERERHIYAIRNETFAAALVQANQRRVWTPDDQARALSIHRAVAAVVVGSIIVAAVIWLR